MSTIRGVATGAISVYIPPPNQSIPYKFLCVYWLFFFSLTQDKFDIVPVCALARVSFTYLHTTINTPTNEIPGYAPGHYQ